MYYVYMVRCKDGTLYTGYSIDVKRRVLEHNGKLKGGGKYTRARRPVKLVYSEVFRTKSQALSREVFIKKLSRKQKLALIAKK